MTTSTLWEKSSNTMIGCCKDTEVQHFRLRKHWSKCSIILVVYSACLHVRMRDVCARVYACAHMQCVIIAVSHPQFDRTHKCVISASPYPQYVATEWTARIKTYLAETSCVSISFLEAVNNTIIVAVFGQQK